MAEAVHKTGNVVLIDKYAQKTALRLGVAPDAVRAEFKKLARAGTRLPEVDDEAAEEAIRQRETAPISAPESWLLMLMLTNDDLVPWVADRLDCKWIKHPTVRRIVEARIASLQADSWTGVPGFLDAFEDEEARSLVTQAVTDRRKIADPARTLMGDPSYADKRGILEQLRDEYVDGQMAALRQRVNNPQTSETEQVDLLRQQQQLRSLKGRSLGPEAGAPIPPA